MRVFPLEPRQEKRLLLSYTQKLPVHYGSLGYRFPAGHSLAQVGEWSLHVRVKGGGDDDVEQRIAHADAYARTAATSCSRLSRRTPGSTATWSCT